MTSEGREARIAAVGQALFAEMRGETPGVFDKSYWQGKILDWAMRDPSFKVDMFRFVDVLPTLRTKAQMARHIDEYLLREGRALPAVLSSVLKVATSGLGAGLGASAIRKNVGDMAGRFIAGADVPAAWVALTKLRKEGFAFTVDLLGEASVSEEECDAYFSRYETMILQLADAVVAWPEDEILDRNQLGPVPRANVSLKISALYSQIAPEDPKRAIGVLSERLVPLLRLAQQKNVFVNFDLEHWGLHALTYALFSSVARDPEFRTWPHLGIVLQAYLRGAEAHAAQLLALAKVRGAPVTVRLVKGAYWDHETVLSNQRGWPCPVLQKKGETDAQFERLTDLFLQERAHISLAVASHNLRSLTHALVAAEVHDVPEGGFEFQMLYGMAEPERRILRKRGHRVRIYAPVGELIPGMAYLVRRLLENTSNSGFLRLSYVEGVSPEVLLQRPEADDDAPRNEAGRPIAASAEGDSSSLALRAGVDGFRNCEMLDFDEAGVRAAFEDAVGEARRGFPLAIPVVVGEESRHRQDAVRLCPSDLSESVAVVTHATDAEVDAALALAAAAWPAWRDTSLSARAEKLLALAACLERDRHALAALICWEVGKPWHHADGDVAEAIDFCRYYARLAPEELGPRRQGQLLGEDNQLFYEGRGVCSVIAPWNFPAAILTGMAAAALVAGNTVLLKPAEQASAVAHAIYSRMQEAGFPPNVVHFLPGTGEHVGAMLVADPRIAQIAFTGSMEVGLSIVATAAVTASGQQQLKRVVCEMGGKNAIIVDDDADLDAAIGGITESAFGYAGQRCSAASRLIVVEGAWDALRPRLIAATKSLRIGPAHRPGFTLGPVVDGDAHARILATVARWADEQFSGVEVLYRGGATESAPNPDPARKRGGWYVPPILLSVDDPSHPAMQEELFGPVLALHRVKSFEQALAVANRTAYALTGGVYSRSPGNLALARRMFRVGNLYLNRSTTGAFVHRQPFGGFHRSGLGTKAGGPNYLLQFADPRVVTENTMRRGFTPELL